MGVTTGALPPVGCKAADKGGPGGRNGTSGKTSAGLFEAEHAALQPV